MNKFERIVPHTVSTPVFATMLFGYEQYSAVSGDGLPCTSPRATNQCAVRMSTALARSGFPIERFPDQKRIQWPADCRVQVPHILGAQELEEFPRLRLKVTLDLKYIRQRDRAGLCGHIQGKKGIIFFDRVYGRIDHIDLFDGTRINNQGSTIRSTRPIM